MLMINRKQGETLVIFERQTRKLIALIKVAGVVNALPTERGTISTDSLSSKVRMACSADESVSIRRLEKTGWANRSEAWLFNQPRGVRVPTTTEVMSRD